MPLFKLAEGYWDQAILEVRYHFTPLFWDASGHIWHDLLRRWPDLRSGEAKPSQTDFRLDNKAKFIITPDRLNINFSFIERTFSDFIDAATLAPRVVAKYLEIEEFTRLGFRIFAKIDCTNNANATERFRRYKFLNSLNDISFSDLGDLTKPQISARWEGDELGASIRILAQEETLSFEQPFGAELPIDNVKTRNTVVRDLDFYTTKPVSVTQYHGAEWINSVLDKLRSDKSKIWEPADAR